MKQPISEIRISIIMILIGWLCIYITNSNLLTSATLNFHEVCRLIRRPSLDKLEKDYSRLKAEFRSFNRLYNTFLSLKDQLLEIIKSGQFYLRSSHARAVALYYQIVTVYNEARELYPDDIPETGSYMPSKDIAVEKKVNVMENNLAQVNDAIEAKLGKISEDIMINLVTLDIKLHSQEPDEAITAIQRTLAGDERFKFKEIKYLSADNQILLYTLVEEVGWAKHYTFSMNGAIVQVGRKISEEEIPRLSWVPDYEQDEFINFWIKLAEAEFLPPQNIKSGLEVGLLEKYQAYFNYARDVLGYDTRRAFKAILTAFLNETTKLIELKTIWGCPRGGEKILDLGTGSWFYIHLLKAYFAEVEKIVGVEKQSALVETAKKTLEFWELDEVTSILIIQGDMIALEAIPEAEDKFDLISIFNALVFFSSKPFGFLGDQERLSLLFAQVRDRLAEGGILVITIPKFDLNEDNEAMAQLFRDAGLRELYIPCSPYDPGIYESLPASAIPAFARRSYLEKLLFNYNWTITSRREETVVFIAQKEDLDKILELLTSAG